MFLKHGGRGRAAQPAIGHVLAWLLLVFAPAALAAPAPDRPRMQTVLVLGDSLSAGYGLRVEEGWVSLLARQVAATRPGWQVVNASVSGATSADGASRILADLARTRPSVVVIELGANDGLRGLPLQQTRINLARIIGSAHGAKARVLLVGMRLPPNFGPEYTRDFAAVYTDLAQRFDVALLPFLLAPLGTARENFQDDNLHPVAAAQPKLRDHVWKSLEPLMH